MSRDIAPTEVPMIPAIKLRNEGFLLCMESAISKAVTEHTDPTEEYSKAGWKPSMYVVIHKMTIEKRPTKKAIILYSIT